MKTVRNAKAKAVTSFALLLALTLTPVLGFAKENNASKHENDSDHGENHLCIKAFGQFVKNGWKETKGELKIGENCKIPHGIWKKWNHASATSTADMTAPVISNILTTISLNKLLVSWKTNEAATSKVFYGTSTLDVNSSTTQSMSNNTLKTSHSFELPAVGSTTPYHVILQSADIRGNTQTSAEYSIYLPF